MSNTNDMQDDIDEAEAMFDRQLGEPDLAAGAPDSVKKPVSADVIIREETDAAIEASRSDIREDSVLEDVARQTAMDAMRRITERVERTVKSDGGRGRRRVVAPPNPWTAAQCAARIMPLGKLLLDGVSEEDYVKLVSYNKVSGLYEPLNVDRLAVSFNATANGSWRRDFECNLRVACRQVRRESDPDLIAVNNGIVRYSTGEFMPFGPEHVFTGKSTADWTDPATPPSEPVFDVTTNGGQRKRLAVSDVFNGFSTDPDVVRFLWDVVVMTLTPLKHWDIAPILYGEGSSGKSTFIDMVTGLVGVENSTRAQLSTLTTRFGMMHILDKTLVASDDESGTYIDDSGPLKSAVTHGEVNIDRKNKMPVSYRLGCMFVVGTNSYPKFRDRSTGIWRRFPVVPFDRVVLPKDRVPELGRLLARQDVRDWMMFHMLYERPRVTGVSLPEAVAKANAEFREAIDPVAAFWGEYRDAFTRDFLPLPMLWSAFKQWYSREFGGRGQLKSSRNFYAELRSLVSREMQDPALPDSAKWVETADKVSVAAWAAGTEEAIGDLYRDEGFHKPRVDRVILSPSTDQLAFWLSPVDELWKKTRCKGFVRKSFLAAYEDPDSPLHGKTPRAVSEEQSKARSASYPSNGRG